MATLLRRPATFEEGIAQLEKAVADTPPARGTAADTPRAKLWRAAHALVQPAFCEGMRLLYDSNALVSTLYNTIVPSVEERLRFAVLEEEHAKAAKKPDSMQQNAKRFDAFLAALRDATDASRRNAKVDAEFASMREAMAQLHENAAVAEGLRTLYTSTKTARQALDMIFERLVHTFQTDTSIQRTTEIPLEALMLR